MAWICAGNPVSMLPGAQTVRSALAKVPLVVVVDTHPNDTTDLADLVLPTATMLEDDDLLGSYGNHYLRASTPALPMPAGVRHEVAIMADLAQRLDIDDFSPDVAVWKARFCRRLSERGVDPARLAQGPVLNPFSTPVLFEGGRVPTASGRPQLLTTMRRAWRPDADFPLGLLAVSVPESQASQHSRPPDEGAMPVRVHPDSTDLADGSEAWLQTRQGQMPVVVRHDDALHPEVLFAPKGGMRRDGHWVNQLIAAVETDGGHGASYYDEGARLRPR
jgi:anaerobic selenocysteine-containing dehydrogenase